MPSKFDINNSNISWQIRLCLEYSHQTNKDLVYISCSHDTMQYLKSYRWNHIYFFCVMCRLNLFDNVLMEYVSLRVLWELSAWCQLLKLRMYSFLFLLCVCVCVCVCMYVCVHLNLFACKELQFKSICLPSTL